MLRAKPKEKKTYLERFIVLGDAKPNDIEARLGKELISHQVMRHIGSVDNQKTDSATAAKLEALEVLKPQTDATVGILDAKSALGTRVSRN